MFLSVEASGRWRKFASVGNEFITNAKVWFSKIVFIFPKFTKLSSCQTPTIQY